MPSIEKFCERMRYWCDDANLGYDQTERWNIWYGGECDCSSLVIHALQEAGFDTGSASYTGDLSWNLTQRGWSRLSPDISTARPGDILLSDANHVAAVVYGWGWWATIAEAWLDEKGGIYYGQAGDQTGLETRTRGIYSFPWDCILRYEGDDMEPVDVWAYKNKSVNGDKDAYKLLTDAAWQLTRTDNAGWASPSGHDIFGRINSMQVDIAQIKKDVNKLQGGASSTVSIDYDKLANKVADVLYARLKA